MHLFLNIMGNMMVSLFLSSPITMAMRSSLLNDINFELREGPMYIECRLGWLHCLSRDVRKCNKLFLDSNKEDILCIAL